MIFSLMPEFLLFFLLNRYAYPWWKEKVIDSDAKRRDGLCPLTPEETAFVLQALDIDRTMQIYIAAGEIYGGSRRMVALTAAYPNVVSFHFYPSVFSTSHKLQITCVTANLEGILYDGSSSLGSTETTCLPLADINIDGSYFGPSILN